jgi:hypothetical protein
MLTLAGLTCRQPRLSVTARQAPSSNLLTCQRPAQLGLSPLFAEATAIYRIAPQDAAGSSAVLETLRGPKQSAISGLPPNTEEGLLFLTQPSAEVERLALLEWLPISSESPALPAIRRLSQNDANLKNNPETRSRFAAELIAGLVASPAIAEACAWEINNDDAQILSLDNPNVLRIEERFASLEPRSALFSPLAAILARRARYSTLLQPLEQPGAEHIRYSLANLLRQAPPAELAPILIRQLNGDQAQHAAWVLARTNSPEAREALQNFIGHSNPELEAAALIAFSGQLSRAARSRAFDLIKTHLDHDPQDARSIEPARDTALQALLDARQRRHARGSIPSGEQLRLQAAGFALARSSLEDRNWLRSHLDQLDNRAIADFLRDRLNNAFTRFDDPW